MRIQQKFKYDKAVKIENRTIGDNGLTQIKGKVQTNIKYIRLNKDVIDPNAEAIIAKQKKFMNFILHLNEKNALRHWRQQVFGLGADPRYKVLMNERRESMRERIFKPVQETKKNISRVQFEIKERNLKIAKTMRTSLEASKNNWTRTKEIYSS